MDLELTLRWLLAERLHTFNITPAALAAGVGIGRPHLSRILSGKRTASLAVWDRLLYATEMREMADGTWVLNV